MAGAGDAVEAVGAEREEHVDFRWWMRRGWCVRRIFEVGLYSADAGGVGEAGGEETVFAGLRVRGARGGGDGLEGWVGG